MGVLTDLIVALPSQADEIAKTYPMKKIPSIDCKGFEQIMAATLWCLLTGKSVDDQDLVQEITERFTLLTQDNLDGPWVFAFPDDFTQLLTEIADDRFDEISLAWSKTEEFGEWYSLEDAKHFLASLREVASRAKAESKSVLMWICL